MGSDGLFLGSTVLWPPRRELPRDPEVHAHCERCVTNDFTFLCLYFLVCTLGTIKVPSSLGSSEAGWLLDCMQIP